jgi:hypothetical protein
MGFKSGLYKGQSDTGMACSTNYALIFLAVWIDALSCMNIISGYYI